MSLINFNNNFLNKTVWEFLPALNQTCDILSPDLYSKEISSLSAAHSLKPFWSDLPKKIAETFPLTISNSFEEDQNWLKESKELFPYLEQTLTSYQPELRELKKDLRRLGTKDHTSHDWTEQVDSLRSQFEDFVSKVSRESPEWIQKVSQARQLEALLTSPSIPCDDKMFAHIHGDHFILDSKFEGNYQGTVTQFRLAFLREKLRSILDSQLCDEESKIPFCKKLIPSFYNPTSSISIYQKLEKKLQIASELYSQLQEEAAYFRKNLIKEVNNLATGDSIFFPGGWYQHAISFQVIKESSDLLTLRIYNTGSQVYSYHSQTTSDTKSLILPFVEITSIPHENFFNLANLKALQSLDSHYPYEDRISDPELYETFVSQLGGKISHHIYSSEDLMEAQRAGTCSYLSQVALFTQLFKDRKEADRFEFEIKLKSLIDYTKANKKKLAYDHESHLLVKNGAALFSANLADWQQQGIVNEIELPFITEKLKEIDSGIKEAEEKRQSDLIKNSPKFSIHHQLDTLSFETPTMTPPEPLSLQELETLNLPKYDSIDLSSWQPALESVVTDLETYLKQFHGLNQNHNYVNNQLAIQSLIQKIPFEDDFWQKMQPTDVLESIRLFTEISKEYLWSFLQNAQVDNERKHELKPVEFLAQLKLLTLTEKLLSLHHMQVGFGVPLFQSPFYDILNRNSLMFQIKDPYWSNELNSIRNYWENTVYNKDLFGDFFDYKSYRAGYMSNEKQEKMRLGLHLFEGNFKTLEWIQNWLDQSEIKVKMKAQFPDLVLQNKFFQAAYLYLDEAKVPPVFNVKDLEKNIQLLPPVFFHVRDLSFITDFFLSGPFLRRTATTKNLLPDFNQGVKYSALTWEKDKAGNYLWRVDHSIFGLKPEMFDQKIKGEPESCEKYGRPEDAGNVDFYFQNSQNHVENPYLRSVIARQNIWYGCDFNIRQRIPPNSLIVYDPENFFKDVKKEGSQINEYELRRLLSLSSIPELQVQETLGYFIRNIHYLAQPDYQRAFKILMFEGGLLEIEFDKHPLDAARFADALARFCSKGYHEYSYENPELAAFFLEVNQYFREHIEVIQTSYPSRFPEGYQPKFLDSREEYKILLSNPKISIELKSQLYRDLARTYRQQQKFQPNELVDLLSATIKSKIFYRDNNPFNKEVKVEFRDILYTKRAEIEHLLTGPSSQSILNSIYSSIRGKKQTLDWKADPHFPRFVTSEGMISIDVLKGKLYEKNKEICRLPEEIKSDIDFQTLFKNEKEIEATSLSENAYGFTTQSGDRYQVIKNANEKIIIQREFNGKWFRYFPGTSVDLEPRALADYYTQWYANHSSKEILMTNKETQTPSYRVEYKRKWLVFDEKIIHQLDENGNDTNLVVMNILTQTSPFKIFEKIEDLPYVIILQDINTGQPKKIELPRFRLSFDVESKAVCRELSDYTIAENQSVPALASFTNTFVLEKVSPLDVTQKIVIIPKQDFKKAKNSFVIQPHLDRKIPEKGQIAAKQEMLVYEVDTQTEKLIPKTDEARFYLAKLYLWGRQYDKAFEYLEGLGSQTKAYTSEVMRELTQIANLNSLKSDNHPKAGAIRLKAAAIILRNISDFGLSLKENLKLDYDDYLQTEKFVGPVKLSEEEEIEIILYLSATSDQIRNRIHHLAPKAYGRLDSLISNKIESSQWIGMKSLAGSEKRFSQELMPVEKFVAHLFYKSPKEMNRHPLIPGLINGLYGVWNGDFSLLEKVLLERMAQPARILRSDLHVRFVDYYKAVRDPNVSTQALRNMILETSGITTSLRMEKKDLIPIIMQSLSLIQASADPVEKTCAIILGAVLQTPEKFPKAEEFIYLEQKSLEAFFSEKFYASLEELGKGSIEISNPEICVAHTPISAKSKAEKIDDSYHVCIQRIDSKNLTTPLLNNPEWLIQRKDLSQEQIQKQTQDKEGLQSLFAVKPADTVAQRTLHHMHDQLEDYAKISNQTTYTLTNPENIQEFKKQLSSAIDLAKKELDEKQHSIEVLANKLFQNPIDRALQESRLFGQLELPLSLNDVIFLYLKGEMQLFHQQNGALSHEEIVDLNDKVQEFLVHATHQQHLERLVAKITTMQKASGEDLDELVQEFAETLLSKREYLGANHPEYLVIEYFSKILLRKDQIENLDKLAIKNGKIGNKESFGAVMEMIMGSGKTAFIAPLLSYMNADGNSLALCVMPDTLLPSMSEEIQKTLGHFRQKLEVINFERSTHVDLKSLERLFEKLSRIRDGKRVLLLSNNSVQALYLKAIEKLHDYAETPSIELAKELGELRKIFKLFKTSGIATLDEVHLILDVLKSFHYTIGEPKPLDLLTRNTISNLYLYLSQNNQINQKIKFSFLSNKAERPFTETFYHQEIKPKIIEGILQGDFFKSNQKLHQFISSVNSEQKKLLTIYLNDQDDQNAFTYVDEHLDAEIQDILSLLKEEISVLLPLTCKKNLDEHYGRADENQNQPTDLLAVPYHDGQVTRNQFGTDPEIVNYTIQMHLEKGISKKIIGQEILRLQKLYRNEKDLPVEQRLSTLQFKKLCGDRKDLHLFVLTDEDIDYLIKNVNQNPELQLELIEQHVLPQVTVYETQLNAEAQMFGVLFKYVQGMTGTLWNDETFPKLIKAVFPSNTMVKTLNILWSKSPKEINIIPTSEPIKNTHESITATLNKIYNRQGIPNGSIIDTGGMFKGLSNKKVAESILMLDCWKGSSIKGVAYYSDLGELMVVSQGQDTLFHQKLAKANFKKEELVAFWDQQRTSGSNIILGHSSTATVPLNEHIPLFTLLQSVFRLRGLAKGQVVNFAVSEEVHEIMKAVLEEITGEKIEGNLELKHILLYTLYVQTKRQGEDNHRSFRRKMEAVLIDKVVQMFVDSDIEIDELATIFKETKELFETSQSQRPFKLYGRLHKKILSQEVINKEVADFLNSSPMQAFYSNSVLRSQFDPDKIKKEIYALAEEELKFLPSLLTFNEQYGKEKSLVVETQVNTKTENQIESQKEIEQIKNTAKGKIEERKQLACKREGLFERSYFQAEDLERFEGKKYESHRPIIKMKEFMKWGDSKSNLIDSDLLGTLNQFPVHTDEVTWDKTKILKHQKISSEVLIIQDKELNQIKLLLIDPEEAKFFKEELIKDSKNPSSEKREVKLALYHIENGIDVTGSERIDQGELEANDRFQKLKVQAKLLKGYTDYNKEEVKILRRMFLELDQIDQKNRYDVYDIDCLLYSSRFSKETIQTALDLLAPPEYAKDNSLNKIMKQIEDKLGEWRELAVQRKIKIASKENLKELANEEPSLQLNLDKEYTAIDHEIRAIEQKIDRIIDR